MNKKTILRSFAFIVLILLFGLPNLNGQSNTGQGEYTLVVTGYDWGPAVNKVVLKLSEAVQEVQAKDFTVQVERSAEGVELGAAEARGSSEILYAYVSDASGNQYRSFKCLRGKKNSYSLSTLL